MDFPEHLLSKIATDKRDSLIKLLSDDPRPSYISDGDRIYTFAFSEYEISFKVNDNILSVTNVEKGRK